MEEDTYIVFNIAKFCNILKKSGDLLGLSEKDQGLVNQMGA